MELDSQIRAVELQLGSKKALIAKLNTQQTNTRKNEEYQAFIREIEAAENQIDELETQELLLMDEVEAAKALLAEKAVKVKEAQAIVERDLKKFEEAAITDGEYLEGLKEGRKEMASKIDPDSLETYELMVRGKPMPVIVSMDERGRCSGCHMVLTDQSRSSVLTGREIVYCENCRRLLH